MNIFDIYLDKIRSIITDLNKKGDLVIPENLNGISAEIPPSKFDCDISTNAAMVLSKLNQKSPMVLAEQISSIIKKNDHLIENITACDPIPCPQFFLSPISKPNLIDFFSESIGPNLRLPICSLFDL